MVRPARLVTQAAIIAHLRAFSKCVQLDVLDRMAKSAAATLASRDSALDFDNRHFVHQFLSVAPMLAVQVCLIVNWAK